jgi:hypothetical protein
MNNSNNSGIRFSYTKTGGQETEVLERLLKDEGIELDALSSDEQICFVVAANNVKSIRSSLRKLNLNFDEEELGE